MLFFGSWGKSEMQLHGNKFVKENTYRRMKKWLPFTILFDLAVVLAVYYYR